LLQQSLVVATDFLAAVKDLLHASTAIQPSLTALLSSAIGATPQQAGNGELPPGNTNSALAAVSMDVSNAQASWQAALAEIPALGYSSAQDVWGIRASNVNTIIQFLRNNLYQISSILAITTGFLDSLPALLGVSQPEHFLLLYLDPNQLLPTGGVASSYATVEVADGAVVSAIRFHSTFALDCARRCVTHGLDELTLNPDFVTRANDAEAALLNEAHVDAHTVIGITPDLISDMLAILGPVQLPELGLTISAGNVRSESARYDERIVSSANGTVETPPDTSGFDISLMSSVIRALTRASHDQLLRIGGGLVKALTTKHMLIFTNYYSIEQQLTSLSVGGRVNSTRDRDTLYVADANLSEDYGSSSISETISDRITLGPGGTAAHHALSITYHYANPISSGAQTLPAGPYHDLVEVMVPDFATELANDRHCVAAVPVVLPYNGLLACEVTINPGQTVTVHMSWIVPIPQADVALHYYEFQVERQPGTQVPVSILIAPAAGSSLQPTGEREHLIKGLVEWTASPLLEDSVMSVYYR
jgi:hypothetical protein